MRSGAALGLGDLDMVVIPFGAEQGELKPATRALERSVAFPAAASGPRQHRNDMPAEAGVLRLLEVAKPLAQRPEPRLRQASARFFSALTDGAQ